MLHNGEILHDNGPEKACRHPDGLVVQMMLGQAGCAGQAGPRESA